jgi:CDP-glucose 4,6-dehydratase
MNRKFWEGRRVLLTGYTGFKGAWTAAILHEFGARVSGIALAPEGIPSLWASIETDVPLNGHITDLRESDSVADIVRDEAPEIILHMAAQAQVRRGYVNPTETYSINLMGTVNLLESLRFLDSVQVVLVVTSDKVYLNNDENRRFCEDDRLGGSDPYSASKAACEHIVRSYAESFFDSRGVPVVTARAGNVIGGGDWSSDRLLPDLYRAAASGVPVRLRYPSARRPWQHVLDCIDGYLSYVEHLSNKTTAFPGTLNFGPDDKHSPTVAELVTHVGHVFGMSTPWERDEGEAEPEKLMLSLDSTRAYEVLGWKPRLDAATMIDWTASWYVSYLQGNDALGLVKSQIRHYLEEFY